MNSLIAIVGPTAVGKSGMALELSQIFDAEIVNADSRQVYKYMDIGTAKPSPEEQRLVPHHLIDVVYPDQDFNLALYQSKALAAIDSIQRKGKLALLTGGSGLYVWSVVDGWQIPPVAPDFTLRQRLEAKAHSEGNKLLHDELKKLDATAAERIDLRNTRRVIRALEVCYQSGSFSLLQSKEPRMNTLIIGLTTDRTGLYRQIDNRVDSMIKKGLISEVEGLVARGYGFHLPSMSSLGYKQAGMYLQNIIDLPTAIQQIKYDTHRFARHQYNWFRLQDKRIHWFEAGAGTNDAVRHLIREFITG
jgi:tRNA dimethylallyltransferase